jgi:hypothetical protein
MTEATVKTNVSRAMAKLGLTHRVQVVLAHDAGLARLHSAAHVSHLRKRTTIAEEETETPPRGQSSPDRGMLNDLAGRLRSITADESHLR